MALAVPTEIWLSVVKNTVTPAWPDDVFFPPADDFHAVKGFARASLTFSIVVNSLRCESMRALDYVHFVRIDVPCQRVRHLRIVQGVPNSDKFFAQIARYTCLSSLSLCSSDPGGTLRQLERLAFAPHLTRLDYRVSSTVLPWRTLSLAFPNLVELRLGASEHIVETYLPRCAFLSPNLFASEEEFATSLVTKLAGLPRLRLLSLHVALDPDAAFRALLHTHTVSLAHLVPSEGYERHYAACPLCAAAYAHAAVVRAEDAATRVLARGLPPLQRVLWTNAWRAEWRDEGGQRGTRIVREGAAIRLVRDDGQGASEPFLE